MEARLKQELTTQELKPDPIDADTSVTWQVLWNSRAEWIEYARALETDALKAAEELHQMADNYNTMLDEAVRLGAELARERHQWIDCKQELPVDRKAVLVWCSERMNQYTACWTGETWHHFGGLSNWYMIEKVTHWTPTPEPPALLEPQPAPTEEPR